MALGMRRQHVDGEHLEGREARLDRLGQLVEHLEPELALERDVEGVVGVGVALPARGPCLDHLLHVGAGAHEAEVHVGGRTAEDHPPRVVLGTERVKVLFRLHRDEVRQVRVRLDAARDHDLPAGVDDPPRLQATVGQPERDDALALDGHVPSADALRRHHVPAPNQQIQPDRTLPRSATPRVLDGYHAIGREVKRPR